MATHTTISLMELGPVIFGGIDGIIILFAREGSSCPAENLPSLFGSHEHYKEG